MGLILKATMFVVFIFIVFVLCNAELYCVFYPAIDTKFAAGFSERKFEFIEDGFSANQVILNIGKPLSTQQIGGKEYWWYSQDGAAAPFADFAWLGLALIFSNNVAIEKIQRVYYD